MKSPQQAGFSVVEGLLVVVILAILGFTGYFVYHARQNTSKTLRDTNKVGQAAVTSGEQAMDFARCKQTAGSKLLETYPEQCVAKNGKTFTDAGSPPSLVIREWGVQLGMTGETNLTYTYVPTETGSLFDSTYAQFNTTALAAYCANGAKDNAGSLGRSAHDPQWFQRQNAQGGLAINFIKQIGNYYFYYYEPQNTCWKNGASSTQNALQSNAMTAVKSDLLSLQAIQ